MNAAKISRWYILGAGAIGCLFASFLARAGKPVSLVLKTPQAVKALREAGGIGVEAGSTHHRHRVDGTTPDAITPSSDAGLILTTKAYDALEALGSVRHCLEDFRVIVLLQNGMGTIERLRDRYGRTPAVIGITSQGSLRTGSFDVRHLGSGESFFGVLEHEASLVSRSAVADLLELPIPTDWSDAIELRMWLKLAVNSVINGLCVVHGCPNGGILDGPFTDRVSTLSAEIQAVIHHRFPQETALDIEAEVIKVAEATRDNICSMRQDLLHGRPTEVDSINGYLCKSARVSGIAVPENERLLEQIRRALRLDPEDSR